MTESPLPSATRKAILRRFWMAYLLLVVCFAGLAIIAVAWHWSLPKDYATGFSFRAAVLILLGAALLINSLSYYIQSRYVRRILKKDNIANQFSVLHFALRFYGYNLAIAVLFSFLGFYPWMMLLFFFAHYPIVFWLLPYHLLMGFLLGRVIQRQLT